MKINYWSCAAIALLSMQVAFSAENSKKIYVLLPDEGEWQSSELMVKYTGENGKKQSVAMLPSSEHCGWVYADFEKAPNDAIFYLKNDTTYQIGVNGLWENSDTASPIDLQLVYESYLSDNLFFIPDPGLWPDTSKGWYMDFPDVLGTCSYVLGTLLYDTDMDLNPVFSDGYSVDPEDPYRSCVGIQPGIVNVDLGADNKPVFSGSAVAKECFGDEKNFNTLFNYTKDVNEVQCYDMPFRHYGTDSRWIFNSDSMVTNELVGGFSPLEESSDSTVVTLNGVKLGPLSTARKPRPASGPILVNDKEAIGTDLDLYCKTFAYAAGKNCQGLFADASEFTNPDLWCWGSYCDPEFKRWGVDGEISVKETRNQHFCGQTHATFTYLEDQVFDFRSEDDLWVFVNKKLAVDNGGLHLPAPGHVVLKELNKTYGEGFLVPGRDYPLDIFFCNRRTGMSNLAIKTNAFVKSSVGVDFSMKQNDDGSLTFDICEKRSSGATCSDLLVDSVACNEEIVGDIKYSIVKRTMDPVPDCEQCADLPTGQISFGGIDLTNPKVPRVSVDKIVGLAPGEYRLLFTIDQKMAYYTFRIVGPEAIAARVTPKTGFTVSVVGPRQLSIVSSGTSAKMYAVMDLQGRVVRQGAIAGAETLVSSLLPGSYIVKVGAETRRVNIR